MVVIETERLILRPPTIDDAKNIYENIVSDEVYHFLPYDTPKNLNDVVCGIQRWNEHENDSFRWYIQKKGEGLIGEVHFLLRTEEEKTVEVGYTLGEKYQKHGYMSEAINSTLSFLKTHNIDKIIAESDSENNSSINLLERLGFVFLYECEKETLALKEKRKVFKYAKFI